MLEEVKPDAVAIATPNVYHRELIFQHSRRLSRDV